jgi:dihydropteroate synthase
MDFKDTFFSRKHTLNLNGTLYDISEPQVMGILNITPDSFYDGGRNTSVNDMLKNCEKMLTDGAAIIDVGAYSSRPGAEDISIEEELSRLKSALTAIRKTFPDAILSVDTFRSEIAKFVIKEFGVSIINDISAGNLDNKMLETLALNKAAYIMMHMRGTPKTMQQNTSYSNLIDEITKYFAQNIVKARNFGISDIIIDPGFGFSKTLEQNYNLLSHLDDFRIFELPILVGLSRKSMIFKTLNTTPDNALAGTISAQTIALLNGANILRVHDVKEAVDTVKIFKAYLKNC